MLSLNRNRIVMVSVDKQNGKPDDEWYELAGSEHGNKSTKFNYTITYFKPDENKKPVPHDKYKEVTDVTYIKWNASDNTTGFMYKNQFHTQSYWPQWISGNELSLQGQNFPTTAQTKAEQEKSLFLIPSIGDMPIMQLTTIKHRSLISIGQ